MSSLAVPAGLSSSTDSTSALQTALSSSGGFSLPKGVFRISKPLQLPANSALIEGIGSYNSVIQQITPGMPVIAGVDVARATLRGVGLTGPGTGAAAAGLSLTRKTASNTFGILLEDVAIQNVTGNGVDAPSGNLILSSFTRVSAINLDGHGFNLTGVPGGAAGTSVDFRACYAVGCALAGFHLAKMNYSAFSACACDVSGTGYVLEECQGIALHGCGTESLVGTGTTMYNDGTSFRVDQCTGIDLGMACWTYDNNKYSVQVTGNSQAWGQVTSNTPGARFQGNHVEDGSSLAP